MNSLPYLDTVKMRPYIAVTNNINRMKQFYILAKIYRWLENPPGRSTVSGGGGSMERNSQFVDHFIGPWYLFPNQMSGTSTT